MLSLSLLPLVARTGTGVSDATDVLGHSSAELTLVLAPGVVAGQQVSVQVETSDDGQVWLAAGDPIALTTSTTTARRTVALLWDLSRYVRARFVVDPAASTPGLTFRLTAIARQVFATRDNIKTMGWVPDGLSLFTNEQVNKALQVQSEIIAGALDGVAGIVAPVTNWGGDVRWAVVQLAVYDLYCNKGTLDPVVLDRANQANAWVKGVTAGKIKPVGLVGSEPEPSATMPGVDAAWAYSDPPWGFR